MSNSSCVIGGLEGFAAFSVNILSAILGSLGNILVCSTVYSSPRLHKAWCYFICSLSLADLLVNLAVQPMEAILTFARMNGICHQALRDAFRLAAYITCGASLMNLAFMSVERCLAIVWPLKQRQLQHLTRVKIITLLVMIWGVPCLLGIPGLIAGKGTRLSSILILIGLVGCYSVILTSYGLLFLRARALFKVHDAITLPVQEFQHGNKSAHSPSKRRESNTRETKNKRESEKRATKKRRKSETRVATKRRESEKRATKTIAVVIALFTLSWVPYGYVLASDPEQNVNSFYIWAVTIGLTNSAVNPIVYFFSNKSFRKNSKRLLRSLFCCCQDY